MVRLNNPLKPIFKAKGAALAPIFTKNGFPINLNSQYDLFKSLFDFALKAFSVLLNESIIVNKVQIYLISCALAKFDDRGLILLILVKKLAILILDNYDSFTFNLLHLVEKLTDETIEVKRNDKISLSEVDSFNKIILSPGPGLPKDAGIMPELISTYKTNKHILGICLGMQAIGEEFGCKLKNLDTVVHGQAKNIEVDNSNYLFNNCAANFKVGRYHSWVIDEISVSNEILISGRDDDGNIMAIEHVTYKIAGVQFHPESILSEYGEQIIKNWLNHSHD